MATVVRFEDLEVWKKARAFSARIYSVSAVGTFSVDFGLRNQIRDSSGSIMDNIAEGFERGSRKEFILFLSYAKGSAGETRSQLYRAFDVKHLDEEVFKELQNEALDISRMLSNLIKYLNGSEIRGTKFLEPSVQYSQHSDTDDLVMDFDLLKTGLNNED